MNQVDYKPGSCVEIKRSGNGDTDKYYIIYPRGSCGDPLEVYCANMNTSSPKEYLDVGPAVNYALYTGFESPCRSSVRPGGRTRFHKV